MSEIFPALLPETHKSDLLTSANALSYTGRGSDSLVENVLAQGSERKADFAHTPGVIMGDTNAQLDALQTRSAMLADLTSRVASPVLFPSSGAVTGRTDDSVLSVAPAGSATDSLVRVSSPLNTEGNTPSGIATALPDLKFISNQTARLTDTAHHDSAYFGVPKIGEDGSEIPQSVSINEHSARSRSFAFSVYSPTPSAAYDQAVYADASNSGMMSWGTGGIGGTIGGGGFTPKEAANFAVDVWLRRGPEWAKDILGTTLSPQVMRDFADVIHGAVKKHGESPAQSIQRQRYKIATSQYGEELRNSVSNDLLGRNLTADEHKNLAVKLAEGSKTFAQFRRDAAYSEAARHKIAEIFKQSHGFDATPQDIDYGSMKTADGWSMQDYRWHEAHSDRVASELKDMISTVQGRPYRESDASWLRSRQDSLGTGQRTMLQTRQDFARWTADHGGYDACFQAVHGTPIEEADRNYAAIRIGDGWSMQDYRWNEAHSDRVTSELKDMISTVQGRPYRELDASWIRGKQDSLGTGQRTMLQTRQDFARWTADHGGYDACFQAVHGTPIQEADRIYAAIMIGNGWSVQDYRWNEAHGDRAAREIREMFRNVSGKEAGDGDVKWLQYAIATGSDYTTARANLAWSDFGKNAVKSVYERTAGIKNPTDFQFMVYQERLAKGADIADITRSIANSWEGHDAVKAVYERTAGIKSPTDFQFMVYQERLAKGADIADITRSIANSWEGHDAVKAVYERTAGIKNPTDFQFMVYQARLAKGADIADITRSIAYSWEGRDAVKAVFERIAGIKNPTDFQFKFYQERLAEGADIANITRGIAGSWEGRDAVKATAHATLDRDLTAEESGHYREELANGRTLSDVRNRMARSSEVRSNIGKLFQLAYGDPATETEVSALQQKLGTEASWDSLRKTQIYSTRARDYLSSIHKQAFHSEITASTLAQYQDDIVHHRDVYGKILELITPKAPPTLQRDQWTYVNEDGPHGIALDGYVPKQNHYVKDPVTGHNVNHPVPDVHSGVTIGHGIDLGQFLKSELKSMGIPDFLLKKLPDELFAPKSGSKGLLGQVAQDWLDKHKLKLSRQEAEMISAKVYEHHSDQIIKDYNKRFTEVPFHMLNTNLQTVIVDLGFRRGPGYLRGIPGQTLIDKIHAGDIHGASEYIKSFGPSDSRYLKNARKVLEK
ncbi:pesticin C-terminus-like muramidase [Swaminathania salitolerans]|uniref:pesticin C-terminus-like muramidase n=1 Tax=Swaminathania salitolerans TaxID=182838 RepID=UPI002156C480|nr:pesticin C-terminus-like muramidase [Swaminathania salitolerans]GBQ15132.1 hypothetical protein AA21291_2069 [Swaminathania salitolerans LMG 21291]